ncbi:acyltransferase family protein [Paracoccus sp. MBLB3053]|uniref:Acyltransferase family protein n=1 Tax=Paracoccus aurantius TaxID=3073814 RepID=A0ABU2HTN4_9RHOB|nr:acyltransferase family protein [Paracoccus sp. MBLB3053]MDS9468388.1 acyltransferase family protein [Paracoccus sp. MBLB3053]
MLTRSLSIDYLKCLLAVGVVLGHSILISQRIEIWSYLVGGGLLRSLVPTFSVVSGFCFYVTYRNGRVLGWLIGLACAYLFWTAFYVPIWVNATTTWQDVLWSVAWGTMHLWYIAGLIVAAVLIVILIRLGQRTRTGLRPMLLAALTLGLAGSALSFWAFFQRPEMPMEYWRNGFTVIFPFAAIGFALAHRIDRQGFDWLPSARLLWALTGLIFGAKIAEAFVGMSVYGLNFSLLPDIPVLAFPAPMLLFLAFLRTTLPRLPVDLSSWSASIYFLHIFFIIAVQHFLGINSVAVFFAVGVVMPILGSIALSRARTILPRRLGGARSQASGGEGSAWQTLRADQR